MNRRSKVLPSFAALVQAWFAEYLTQQRALSAHTIAAYRDSFVLFLEFAEARVGTASLHYGSDMRAPSRRITMSKPIST
jgi:site-specific recombinase XerD